jgi:hypothetical protein
VFAYASLAGDAPADGYPARLHGWRRGWGVAMDNTVTIPGYKYYLDADGARPAVCVAFLDLDEAPGAWVNGVCLPVNAAMLDVLDDRERNYERVEVTSAVEPLIGRTWAYTGRADSRRRFGDASATGRCVVARAYLDAIEQGFRALDGWEDFTASTDGERPPVRNLRRVDVA